MIYKVTEIPAEPEIQSMYFVSVAACLLISVQRLLTALQGQRHKIYQSFWKNPASFFPEFIFITKSCYYTCRKLNKEKLLKIITFVAWWINIHPLMNYILYSDVLPWRVGSDSRTSFSALADLWHGHSTSARKALILSSLSNWWFFRTSREVSFS